MSNRVIVIGRDATPVNRWVEALREEFGEKASQPILVKENYEGQQALGFEIADISGDDACNTIAQFDRADRRVAGTMTTKVRLTNQGWSDPKKQDPSETVEVFVAPTSRI